MQQLHYGFSNSIKELQPKSQVNMVDCFDPMVQMKFHAKLMVEIAKMLMFCQAFVELTLKDKVNGKTSH